MATNIKASTIAATYDRLVLVQDGNDIGSGTDTMNIEIQTQAGVATATPLYISTNRVGIGTAVPDGLLHIFTATAGSMTASANADELILEGSADVGMTIACPANQIGSIFWADPDGDDAGAIVYDHGSSLTDTMTFRTVGVDRIRINASGHLGVNTTGTEGFVDIEDSSTDNTNFSGENVIGIRNVHRITAGDSDINNNHNGIYNSLKF